MSETTARRTGRRAGDAGTRESILEAARVRFAEHGYDGATIRGIAGDAGVDPALVHHYFGTKEKLFVAAMRFPAVPSEVIRGVWRDGPDGVGERLARAVLGVWESQDMRSQAEALLRSAVTNDRAARMLREFVTSAIIRFVAEVFGQRDVEYRASLVASQIIGLGIARYVVRLEPLASASAEDVAAAIGPTLQRYLTGDVRA
jgi:AcrR family transcriptional regulator